jgi:hypothetical protein
MRKVWAQKLGPRGEILCNREVRRWKSFVRREMPSQQALRVFRLPENPTAPRVFSRNGARPMGCPGRKRKSGAREANGRLARVKAAERKALVGERAVVLKQPHRRDGNGGNLSQLCESPVGQFILRHRLRSELYDAALQYGSLARRFLRAKANGVDIVECAGTGQEMSTVTEGFAGLRQWAIFERPIAPEAEKAVIPVIYRLAASLGRLGSRGRHSEIGFTCGVDGLGVSARHARP